MKSASVKLALGVLLCALSTQAVPATTKAAIESASKAGQFLFLTFYEAKDAPFTSMAASVEAFRKTGAKKSAIYHAKVSDPANAEIAAKYGIQTGADLPLLLVMAPNGVVTGGFPKSVTADQLRQSVSVSDLMLKVLKPLQEQKVAIVALQNGSTKLNAESWQGVTEFTNDTTYRQFVTAVKADPAAAGSQEFVKQCQLIAPLTQATVVVLLPPGKIGKVLTGKTTKADILSSLQACATGSSCKPGACSDRRFKQNIAPIVSALDMIGKLQGVRFTWNRAAFPYRFFPEGTEIGLIAQDVEPTIPEVVRTDTDGYKTIAYDKLTAVLIEAVKEMTQKMAVQDSVIQAQNARIAALEGKNP
jgi:hypothetical protein